MRMAICDDDERELAHLSELITEYQLNRGVSVDCRFFCNGTDFLCDMKGGEYDLVLLDILMPEVSGIHVAQELREMDKNVKLIFISSSPEFAVDGYHVEAYYYLIKPVDAGLLFPLLDRVQSEISVQDEQKFILKSREGIIGVAFARLEYVEVINKTVNFHLVDGTVYETPATLADFERIILSRPEFIKPHRSYLINLSYVQKVGISCAVMKSGHNIPISRQRRNKVQDAYMCFLHRSEMGVSGTGAPAAVSNEGARRSGGPWRILLVDDDSAARIFWADILRSHGCIVQLADNGESAVKLAAEEAYSCVLLDVMLPGEDGFSVCEKLHRLMDTPVIFLSCATESDKQLTGFAAGCVDYITKDTPADLFWAKVETRIRLSMAERTQFCYGPLLLDLAGRRAMINGEELPLTPVEFDILWHISENTGHIFTLAEIYDMVWGGQLLDNEQAVQKHMSGLRRKLGKAWEEHQFIETVWGQGYRFTPPNH